MAFAPDDRTLVSVSGWEMIFWEVATGRDRLRVVRPNLQANSRIAFSPDGNIAAGTTAGPVLLLDATDGWELARFKGPT